MSCAVRALCGLAPRGFVDCPCTVNVLLEDPAHNVLANGLAQNVLKVRPGACCWHPPRNDMFHTDSCLNVHEFLINDLAHNVLINDPGACCRHPSRYLVRTATVNVLLDDLARNVLTNGLAQNVLKV